MNTGRILLGGVAALLLLVGSVVSPAYAQQLLGPTPVPPPGIEPEVIPGQYIVELKRAVERDAFINEHRVAAFRRYTIINGFAARMSERAAIRLAANVRIRSVSPDLVVHASPKPDSPPGKKGGGGGGDGDEPTGGNCPDFSSNPAFDPTANPEVAPTGVSRIDALSATATGAGVKVAVIDTGIDPCHPDLVANYKGGKNLLKKGNNPPLDDNGHGTHVAGIIAAAANGFGVVGVAPEVDLYAVKVLDAKGEGTLSTVIKGLDWAAKNKMRVANLSLTAIDFSFAMGPMCTAVANAAAAGVTVVAAAGNFISDAIAFTPANCVDSLTVSAFVDLNGMDTASGSITIDGGFGPIVEYDETFANSFSNYSNYCWDLDGDFVCTNDDTLVVNLMGPGVEILSTTPTSSFTLSAEGVAANYGILTGTSMAAPHVAGASALFIEANPTADTDQVRTALTIGLTMGSTVYTGGECDSGTPGSSLPLQCSPAWPDYPDFSLEPSSEPLVDAGP
ncbi:MAG: S8 family serine peptidase [Candidatus Methylomirabilales bacterium]